MSIKVQEVSGFILTQYIVLWPTKNVFYGNSKTCRWLLIIGETVQNQDKEWLTISIYQAKRTTVFIQTSLLVSIPFVVSVQIGDINISLLLQVFIFTFAPAGSAPHQWVGGIIIPLWTSLVVFNWFIISTQNRDTNLSYGCGLILPFSNHSSLTFWSLSLLVTVVVSPWILKRSKYLYYGTNTSIYEPYIAI